MIVSSIFEDSIYLLLPLNLRRTTDNKCTMGISRGPNRESPDMTYWGKRAVRNISIPKNQSAHVKGELYRSPNMTNVEK